MRTILTRVKAGDVGLLDLQNEVRGLTLSELREFGREILKTGDTQKTLVDLVRAEILARRSSLDRR